VLVDYPDFNLRLARAARAVGVPVLYFIPPKVWAWRPGRVRAIAAAVDRVAAIFPFEPEFYRNHGYGAVTYVGHPLGDRASECAAAAVRADERTLLLLPGSRRFEVERILPPLLRVFAALRERHPDLRARVVLAPTISSEWALQLARTALSAGASAAQLAAVEWSHAEPLAEMLRAHTGILKSGTCNLEGAMAGLPFVSVYSGSWFSKIIVDLLVSLREYSPVNILRRGTVREFMQVRIDEPALTAAVDELLIEGPTRQQVQRGLAEVRAALLKADPVGDDGVTGSGQCSVAERVARLAYEMAAQSAQGRSSGAE
jgi:lipid-A-disaccharide synthase